jgi:hypothetical protein
MRRHTVSTIALLALAPLLTLGDAVHAHPGSGVFVDDQGAVFFVDTGRGVWQLAPDGKLTLLSNIAMHWLAYDAAGAFASAPDQFGEWFGRTTPPGQRPTLVSCSDFPCTLGRDGNLYFPFMHGLTINRRTPTGEELLIAAPRDFGYDDEHALGVNGIAAGSDNTLYIVMLDDLHQSSASADHWLYAVDPNAEAPHRVRLVKKDFIPPDEIIPPSERHHESIPQYCRGLAADDESNVYIAATGNRCVIKVTPAGESSIVLRCEKPWTPTAVAFRAGDLYVLEYDDETPTEGRNWPPRVRKLTAAGEVSTLVTIQRD